MCMVFASNCDVETYQRVRRQRVEVNEADGRLYLSASGRHAVIN